MSEQKDGCPAFPVKEWPSQGGMSLRDWFAGQVVSGCLANTNTVFDADYYAAFARMTYQLADAMLAERAKPR